MHKTLLAILFIILFSISCQNHKKEYISIKHFSQSDNNESNDSLIQGDWTNYFETFDTVPKDFGIVFFENIVSSINDTSEFKRIWGYNYERADSIEDVMIKQENALLDPQNLLSDNSYFMIIVLREKEISIGSSIFLDFKNEEIGTFIIPDSVEDVKLQHKVKVDGLASKMKILRQ